MDPAKLKVVELRAELSKRGLDSKGNKPALVKRLKEALEQELAEELPDTSIADTSTEDVDSSQNEDQPPSEQPAIPDKIDKPEETLDEQEIIENTEPSLSVSQNENQEKVSEEQVPEVPKQTEIQSTPVDSSENQEVNSNIEDAKENGTKDDVSSQEPSSDTGTSEVEPMQHEETKSDVAEKTDNVEHKGEKRRHSSPSPDRSQRRRSKSPIKEDEPSIDQDKVQLSWYDSDLHLQVDKESFLSAKPYHEGAFGFAWAGVRATHGINCGKVCFEVKITEGLKWEDFSKYYEKNRRDHRSPPRQKNDERKKSESETEKEPEKDADNQQENGDKAEQSAEADVEMKEPAESEETKQEDSSEPEKPTETADAEQNEKVEEKEEPSMEVQEQTEAEEPAESKEQTEPEPMATHLFRVGWSLVDTALQLGEDKFSYGYESTGKFVVDKNFQEYGIQYGVGDVIASFLSIDETDVRIAYAVNGVVQPEAVSIPLCDLPENFAFFPHVLSRNYAFELNLGSKDCWFPIPSSHEEYVFLDKFEDKVPGPARPESRTDCEVILMCGLPASGKTHWVKEYLQSNLDKKYTVLGNTHLLDKMTVSGDTLKSKYRGSWSNLLEKLQKCLNKLVEIAALRRRNYIIDQPNVYPSAQRRKLRPFEGFKRRAVVVVVGDEEQAKRQSLQEAEGGKDVPDSIVLDMKANMSLPQKGDWIDEVVFVGSTEEEAKSLVQKYNNQGRESIAVHRRYSHRDDRNRWQNRRHDYRSGYRDRGYHGNRYDRGPPRQGNWQHRSSGGWNRDRRDNRPPPMSRDWRNRGRERNNRDLPGNYNRNRNPPSRGGGGGGGNWSSNWGQSQGGWGGNQPWAQQGTWGQGAWNNQASQNQWKYGGGSGGNQGYGSYSNWGYYGQYPQNWGSQNQAQTSATGTNQYGQYSQQDWAQYAQQYAQQGQTTTTNQSTPQK